MFSETLPVMLQKQSLAEYLFSKVNLLKIHPAQKLECFIVQVLSSDQITDGVTNFQAKFRKQFKKGSLIRLVDWKLDFKSFQILIEDSQYLGGAGTATKCGKSWDVEKLKLITNSSIISKDFVVLHNPEFSAPMDTREPDHPLKLPEPKQVQFFTLPAARSKYYEDRIHKKVQQAPHNSTACSKAAPSQHLAKQITINDCEMDEEITIKPERAAEEALPAIFTDSTPKKHKIFQYSQTDIQNVRKLRVGQQPDEKTLTTLSIRQLMSRKKKQSESMDQIQNNESRRGEDSAKMESQPLSDRKSTVNEDSKGRQLVFNKEEVKKLLGKQ